MSKQYIVVKLDGDTYQIEVDKPQALDFDNCISLIHGKGNKTRIIDNMVQVHPSRFAIGRHIVIVTHIIGMPGLRETWMLLPKISYLEKHWTNYFTHVINTNAGLSQLPERYITPEAKYETIKHD